MERCLDLKGFIAEKFRHHYSQKQYNTNMLSDRALLCSGAPFTNIDIFLSQHE